MLHALPVLHWPAYNPFPASHYFFDEVHVENMRTGQSLFLRMANAVWSMQRSSLTDELKGFVDLIDHFIVGTSGSSFPSYLSLAAAGAVTMGLGYYFTKNTSNGKITPLVDPLNQTIKQKVGLHQ
ncbi:unnamed protein product [Strongylus vulgaris]|uniref:Uncharacterized protein n=1 Tax=Strongylus vulgaris TaxID=40348 RepID=A0A3P7LWS2_STRVU|nr:unnamed protein product [Strongylus vulgaris]